MYRVCFRYVGDTETAKELVQDIFKSIWERKDELVIETDLESYLMKALKFRVFTYVRQQVNQEKYATYLVAEQDHFINYTERQVLFTSLAEHINELVGKLPERCREVFRLSREKGLANKQIADKLTISEKAVEKQLSKALLFLRERLSEYKI